jgi:hypothetical protein
MEYPSTILLISVAAARSAKAKNSNSRAFRKNPIPAALAAELHVA